MSDQEQEHVQITGGGSSASSSRTGPVPAGGPSTSAARVLPILGLSDIVIFPGMNVPLLVESAPSIRLIDDVVAGDRLLGLILQKKPELDHPMPEDLWSHGCLAKVTKMLKFPDNSVRILIEGVRRFRPLTYVQREPYLTAEVEVLSDMEDNTNEVIAMARSAKQSFERIGELSVSVTDEVKVALLNTHVPGKIADLIAPHTNLSLEEKQGVLELAVVRDRLSYLLPLLGREVELNTLGSKIQKDVADSMSKSQREFYLREQLKAIHRELGDEGASPEIDSLETRIVQSGLPEEVRKVARKELDRLRQIPPMVAEHAIARNYVEWLADLPWNTGTEDVFDLDRAAKVLDSHHHGLGKVKERLLEFLAVLKLNRRLRGPILCLVGPPGVGKTSLGQSVAEALGRKFGRVALGGLRDEAEIRGHRRTYVGAMPGRIIQMMKRLQSNNPVLLLDELDKVGADVRGDPAAALLEVLDPEQNASFSDHYLDVPFDLSRVFFMATANWLEPVYPALRDRLEILEIPSYTHREKVQIAVRHLVPRQIREHGLTKSQVRVPTATLDVLIRDHTREAGVRNLDREIGAVVRKSARRLVEGAEVKKPIVVTPALAGEMLGAARFQRDPAEVVTGFGMAMGLAWTPVGGEVMVIEASRMSGNGKLILTGSLGDVMKESAQIALSYVRSQLGPEELERLNFDKNDLHIHVPSGAVPKDGPSAGVTMACAVVSLFRGLRCQPGIAMTGEISLRGRVLQVGGIKEKVLAALRAGMTEVILPKTNSKDWNDVPEEARKRLKAHFVGHIDEALKVALIPKS